MFILLKDRLSQFARGTDGTVSVEAVLVLPVLLWLFGACWVWFDVSREQSINQKVNYTIGDMISRETDPLNEDYIDHSYELMQSMLTQDAAITDLRITVLNYQSKNGNNAPDYGIEWSRARGGRSALTELSAEQRSIIPIMARGDELVLVETWSDYEPAMEAGLDPFEITTYSFTRPRFAPQILFEGENGANSGHANNGWGNGDQDAPGGSLCNNNAENWGGNGSSDCADNSGGGADVEPGYGGGRWGHRW